MDDDDQEFEAHVSGRESRLEPHRIAILKMRESNWPYRKIVKWLEENRQTRVNPETLRRFCLLREIGKGKDTSEWGRGFRKKASGQAKSDSKQPGKRCEDDWDLVVPDRLETWKSRGESRPET